MEHCKGKLKLDKKVSTIDFKNDRSFLNKLGRIFYRSLRMIYVSFIFYFQPYIVMYIYYLLPSAIFNKTDKDAFEDFLIDLNLEHIQGNYKMFDYDDQEIGTCQITLDTENQGKYMLDGFY